MDRDTARIGNAIIAAEVGEDFYDKFKDGAVGAIPNGTTVYKINSEPNDLHENGKEGIVIGSVDVPENPLGVKYCYLLQYKGLPAVVFAIDTKLSITKP